MDNSTVEWNTDSRRKKLNKCRIVVEEFLSHLTLIQHVRQWNSRPSKSEQRYAVRVLGSEAVPNPFPQVPNCVPIDTEPGAK